jgi:hypothetical protein
MFIELALDALLLVHGFFILFVVFGGLLGLWRVRLLWLHVLTIAWGMYIELFQGTCPLTTLEFYLRARAGILLYSGGFIDHYIAGAIYPDGLSRAQQTNIGIGLIIWTIAVYGLVLRRYQTRRNSRGPSLA